MKRILLSLAVIGFAGATAFGLSSAFFSDTETSGGNTLQAGELDLKIDNESYLNGVLQEETTWTLDDLIDKLFFNFTDIKPSDLGEDTISLHAENDYWACFEITTTKNDDATCTEPELIDDPTCDEPDDPEDNFDGELAQNLNFIFWVDDGDNVLEEGEEVFEEGNATNYFDGKLMTLADSLLNLFEETGPLIGSTTYYIGKAWCFGTLTQEPLTQDNLGPESERTPANSTGGVACDGDSLNNATQTDVVMGDISFSAFQARHNPDFTCSEEEPSPTPTATPTPTPTVACGQADVMLVLDRSGSINSTELGQLKTAAKAFVDALGLSTTGIHAGQSSFATTATLDHHLTDDAASLKAAVDALTSGGFTNLAGGIDLAKTELDNPGDGHDRADAGSPDKMIVITDGHPNRPLPSGTADDVAATSADAARAAGVEVFVVGVGGDVDATYLQNEIADDAGNYYSVSEFSGLETILEDIDLCE